MQVTNCAFIGRPYITDGDSYGEVADTLERLPFMIAIQTHYVPATDTEGAFIVATCKGIRKCIQVAYAHEHSRHGTHYVAAMAQLVLDETGLLPHANTGAMDREELAMLRLVSPSQGMMVESLRDDLDCHRGAPDKVPARRLQTLEWAGELQIPYTTGILVGIVVATSPWSLSGQLRVDHLVALSDGRDEGLEDRGSR